MTSTTESNAAADANMALWRQVRDVPEECLSPFRRPGGFAGTSINAMWVVQKATEMFGPAGKGWGWDIVDERYVETAPIFDANGTMICREILHVLRVKVWYMMDGVRYETGPHFGQTNLLSRNKNGISTDEEAPKKSLTDALKKALSILGFGAGIWLKDFTDDKYVRSSSEPPVNGHAVAVPMPSPGPVNPWLIPPPQDWTDAAARAFYVGRMRAKFESLRGQKAPESDWLRLFDANIQGLHMLEQHEPSVAEKILSAFVGKGVKLGNGSSAVELHQ